MDAQTHIHTHETWVIHHCGDLLCCIVIGCQIGLVLQPVGLLILPVSVAPLSVGMFVVQCPIRHTFTLNNTYAHRHMYICIHMHILLEKHFLLRPFYLFPHLHLLSFMVFCGSFSVFYLFLPPFIHLFWLLQALLFYL